MLLIQQLILLKHLNIKEFLEERFVNDPKKLKQFSSVLINKVKLIRIETPNLKNALRVFETINDRGVGLTSVDLLKNYLFINTSHLTNTNLHWNKLKTKWDKLMKILYKHKEDPMRFLRYYIMSHYEVNLQNNFPEEDIYDWFTQQGDKHGIVDNSLNFVDELITASEHYCFFTQAKNIDGSDNMYLKNIQKLQGRYRQHFILLLAGRFLSKDLFTKLCSHVENLLFVYTITRSTRKNVNIIRNFSQWSKKLRTVQNYEHLSHFVQEYVQQEYFSLYNEFERTFRELTETKIAKFRLRYILSKIAQFIEEKAYSNSKPLDWYLNKSIQIEHILPKSVSSEAKREFDKSNEYNSYVQKLGNLTLLEKTINSSISDNIYELKKTGYRESQLFITRSLVDKPNVGGNTQLNRAVQSLGIQEFDRWNSESIDKRQKMLEQLAKRVWGLE